MYLLKKLWILLALVLISSPALATKYKLDESHTRIGFKVRHLGFSYVAGQFKKFSGQGDYNEKTGKIKSLNVKIETASIDTNEVDRDKHLRTDDFFAVAKFPTLKFVMSKVNYSGNQPQSIQGKITLRGVTKEITLKITDWGGTAVDPWGNERIAFEAVGKLDRRVFGLTWNKGLKKAAGLAVGNEVKLVLNIEGIKVQP